MPTSMLALGKLCSMVYICILKPDWLLDLMTHSFSLFFFYCLLFLNHFMFVKCFFSSSIELFKEEFHSVAEINQHIYCIILMLSILFMVRILDAGPVSLGSKHPFGSTTPTIS